MKPKTMIINVCSIVAILALLIGLGAGIAAFAGALSLEGFKSWFLVTTVLWFAASPFWFVPGLFGEEFARAGEEAWLRPKKK